MTFAEAIAAGRIPLQAWILNPTVLLVEIVARSGFDSVGLDLQHGNFDSRGLDASIAVLESRGVTSMVRVPSNDRGWVTRVLDAGARGVICPDIDDPSQALEFASAAKYPPIGRRGFGPVRPAIGKGVGYAAGGEQYSLEAENRETLAIAQIESTMGLENVEEIVATEGIDAIMPGPLDFALSAYGEPIADISDPRLREPLESMVAAAHAAGKFIGLPAFTLEAVGTLLEMGVDWIQTGNDVAWVTASANRTVSDARSAIDARKERRP